jgi:hypothetical protein
MSSPVSSSSVTSAAVVFGSGAVAFFARLPVAGSSAPLGFEARDLVAAALAGLSLVPLAVVLLARLAGAVPFADFAAPAGFPAFAGEAFLAGALVAVRFTGSSVAGRAFVAATYTLSVLQGSDGHGSAPSKSVGCRILAVDLAAIRDAAAIDHCNDSVR